MHGAQRAVPVKFTVNKSKQTQLNLFNLDKSVLSNVRFQPINILAKDMNQIPVWQTPQRIVVTL